MAKLTMIKTIEERLIKKGYLLGCSESDDYRVDTGIDFNQMFASTFSCRYTVNAGSNYAHVKKTSIREIIRETMQKGISKKTFKIGMSVGGVSKDCDNSYINHLSDYDSYSYSGNLTLELKETNPEVWKLTTANVSGCLQNNNRWSGYF